MATAIVFVILCTFAFIANAKPKSAGSVQSPVLNPDPNPPPDTKAETLGNKFEGDMVLPPGMSPDGKNRNALTDKTRHWTNARVCYYFDTDSAAVRKAVKEAIADFENFTCIRFHERVGTETPCIRIFQGQGCFSYVGMFSNVQALSLGIGCEYKGTAEHEFMHALGYSHEQSRGDRDEYLEIIWKNIEPGQEHNFDKEDIGYSTYGYPYDYNSVMHYGFTFFSANGEPTIKPKDPNYANRKVDFQRYGFTELDIKKLNKVYCDAATEPAGTFKTLKDFTQYKTTIVDWMNKMRRTVGASNMRKLSWNDQLATEAASTAKECTDIEYSATADNSKFTIRFAHSSNYTDLERATAPFFSAYESQITQQRSYIADQYRQLLNANASNVGCALSVCQGLKASNKSEKAEYFQAVCTFSPMLIVADLWRWNLKTFLNGTGCSLCTGHTCDNGLCDGGRICSNKRDCDCGIPNNSNVGKVLSTEDISAYKDGLVHAMNTARGSIGAAAMLKLTWDDALAAEAATITNQCSQSANTLYALTAANHSSIRVVADQSCSDVGAAFAPVIAAFTKTYTDFVATNKCSDLDYYPFYSTGYCFPLTAAVINAASNKVGCAVTKCGGLKNNTVSANFVTYLGACVFDPPMGRYEYLEAFTKGPACSQCSGGTCEGGLCVGGRICFDDPSYNCARKMSLFGCDWLKQVGYKCGKTCGWC